MRRRYPVILGALSAALTGLAVVVVAVLRAAWERLAMGSPVVPDPEEAERYQREFDALNRLIQVAYPTVGSIILAAAIPAIAAIALLAVRQAQRASASATASRDAS